MSNDEAIWQRELLYHSKFLVRYSIFLKALGELIILELSTVKECLNSYLFFLSTPRDNWLVLPARIMGGFQS
jgi:hypothetical protein